jgi:hypothetical protein
MHSLKITEDDTVHDMAYFHVNITIYNVQFRVSEFSRSVY